MTLELYDFPLPFNENLLSFNLLKKKPRTVKIQLEPPTPADQKPTLKTTPLRDRGEFEKWKEEIQLKNNFNDFMEDEEPLSVFFHDNKLAEQQNELNEKVLFEYTEDEKKLLQQMGIGRVEEKQKLAKPQLKETVGLEVFELSSSKNQLQKG